MLDGEIIFIANNFGLQNQAIKTMEECSELIQALSKQIINGNNMVNVIEEIADTELMIDQLKYLLKCNEACTIVRDSKIKRTITRIAKSKEMNFDSK